MDIKRTAGNPGDNGGELALAVCVFVRFRRFRLISIDTHLWSECDKQMVDTQRKNTMSRRHQFNLISSACRVRSVLSGDVSDRTPRIGSPPIAGQSHIRGVSSVVALGVKPEEGDDNDISLFLLGLTRHDSGVAVRPRAVSRVVHADLHADPEVGQSQGIGAERTPVRILA